MYRYVAFDVDGTLLNTESAAIKSLQKLLHEEQNRDLTDQEVSFVMGMPSEKSLERLGFACVEQAARRWGELYREYAHEIRLFPGVADVIRELAAKGVVTGVVTSKSRKEWEDDIVPFGLTEFLPIVICADDTEHHKPHPEPLLRFLSLAGAKPEETLYIGDTEYDAACALAAGVDFALALWGAKHPETITAEHRLREVGELLSLVSQHRPQSE